jgi:hypothetical protein
VTGCVVVQERRADSFLRVFFVSSTPASPSFTGPEMNDKIWFTYKARIRTHERLVNNDLHSQALLVWYAVAGVCLSIITTRFPTLLGKNTDIISAMFSVAVLAVSMFVTNRDYRGRAIEIRKNYLELQALYGRATAKPPSVSQQDLLSAYQNLISSAENHSETDDKYFRVFHHGGLNSRQPTRQEKIEIYLYLAIRTTVLCLLYVLPLLALFFI